VNGDGIATFGGLATFKRLLLSGFISDHNYVMLPLGACHFQEVVSFGGLLLLEVCGIKNFHLEDSVMFIMLPCGSWFLPCDPLQRKISCRRNHLRVGYVTAETSALYLTIRCQKKFYFVPII